MGGPNDFPEISADQDAWLEIARSMRAQFVKMLESGAVYQNWNLSHIDVARAVAQQLMGFELAAGSYDRTRELLQARGSLWSGD